jgi:hypothetical protein
MVSYKPTADEHTVVRRNGVRAFLECILVQREELALDETQFNTLSRLYWDRSNRHSMIDCSGPGSLNRFSASLSGVSAGG